MNKLRFRVPLVIMVFGLWAILVLPITTPKLIIGVVLSVIFLIIPFPGAEVYGDLKFSFKKVAYFIAYIFYFLWAVVKSNLDVAFRVLSPQLPINPGIVKVKTKLKSSLGRLVLANSITLTPGTITVDIENEFLYIHWINIDTENQELATGKIVQGFEKYLEVIFG